MPTPSPRLGLALPSQPDDFSTADLHANWSKIDAAPGTHICTSTTRPPWGVNQAGREIFETNTGVKRAWTGSAWQALTAEPGDIKASARTDVPEGWLVCDGTTRSRSTFSHLFAAIGTSHNVGGEASTEFRLPNLIGKVILGRNPVTGQTYNVMGQALGSPTVTLTSANLPPHAHSIDHDHPSFTSGGTTSTHTHGYFGTSGGAIGYASGPNQALAITGSPLQGTGSGGELHTHTVDVPLHQGSSGNGPGASAGVSIMQPSVTLNYLIKI